MLFRPASQLVAKRIEWLWPSYLALGKLSLLDGDPGLGKSLLMMDLCARLSKGLPFPDGQASPGPAKCLILYGEDDSEEVLRSVLEHFGADLDRIWILDRPIEADAIPLLLPAHIRELDERMTHIRPQLVVIDPIVAFLESRICMGNDQLVRQALYPLQQLAARHHSAVHMNRHLNKKGTGPALYRGSGSIGFQGVCRTSWLAARDPEVRGQCVLAQVKNNLAPVQPSLAYQVEKSETGLPSLIWRPAPACTADQLLAAAPALRPHDLARDFLIDFLKDGPRLTRDLWPAAEKEGLCKRTLTRAKRELQIRCIRIDIDKKTNYYWLLPDQELPDSIPEDAVPPSLEPWLKPLREQFPPQTPLEEERDGA